MEKTRLEQRGKKMGDAKKLKWGRSRARTVVQRSKNKEEGEEEAATNFRRQLIGQSLGAVILTG